MKKFLTFFSVAVALVLFVTPVFAVKPTANLPGAVTYGWHLSGSVMPVPPYGSSDIPGSDTASKLIVNQPNGNTEVAITGVMNGLNPNTTYTVYLAKPYTKYTAANVTGITGFNFEWQGSNYVHSANLNQTKSDVTGDGGYPAGGPYTYAWTITNGYVSGNHLHLVMDYMKGANCTMTMDGDINSPGNITNGTWTSLGRATQYSGTTWFPSYFTSTIPSFTFTTDEFGSGSWHVNVKDADLAGLISPYMLSVWINGGGATILVSDNFTVVK